MPISKEEFEKGEIPPGLSKLIANFLIPNRGTAFTIQEIHSNILPDVEQDFAALLIEMNAIDILSQSGLIEARRFPNPDGNGYTMYYTSK